MNVALIILGAGSSTRMNSTKQLLPIGNTTLLGLSIENALQSKANRVFCVLGSNVETIKNEISGYNIEIVINKNYKEGLGSSIVEALHHIESKSFDSILIMLGDQPKVDPTYINSLILSSKKNPTKIIASKYEDNIGVPAIFPKAYFKQLQQLKGDKGAKEFLNTQKTEIISIESEKLIDIDTEEDYHNFLNSL